MILTASDEEQDKIDGYDLDADIYICEPAEFGSFVEAVRQLGLYWLVLNQTASNPGEFQCKYDFAH